MNYVILVIITLKIIYLLHNMKNKWWIIMKFSKGINTLLLIFTMNQTFSGKKYTNFELNIVF